MQNYSKLIGGIALSATLLLSACSDSDDNPVAAAPVISVTQAEDSFEHYITLGYNQYTDAHAAATELQTAIQTFLDDVSESNLTAARNAWISAREVYGPTEAWRGWGGPIEGEDSDGNGELEGLINAWPLDEAYIDYVDGDADAGIVYNTTDYPTMNATALLSANGVDSADMAADDVVTVGWHAIEFLLWGQDLAADGPGARPATDFTGTGDLVLEQLLINEIKMAYNNGRKAEDVIYDAAPTAKNGEQFIPVGAASSTTSSLATDRRRAALAAASDILVDHLEQVRDEWNPAGTGNFASQVLDGTYNSKDALGWMANGMNFIYSDELSIERMQVAMDIAETENETAVTHPTGGVTTGESRSQELEHSCFSDNTHRDIYLNALGVQYLYNGTWDNPNGNDNDLTDTGSNSIKALLEAVNPTIAADVTQKIQDAVDACEAISDLATQVSDPVPFDNQVLIGSAGSRTTVSNAITKLQEAGEAIQSAAETLELDLATISD